MQRKPQPLFLLLNPCTSSLPPLVPRQHSRVPPSPTRHTSPLCAAERDAGVCAKIGFISHNLKQHASSARAASIAVLPPAAIGPRRAGSAHGRRGPGVAGVVPSSGVPLRGRCCRGPCRTGVGTAKRLRGWAAGRAGACPWKLRPASCSHPRRP